MTDKYAIFSDESPDHTEESAVETGYHLTREDAEKRLAEIRAEHGGDEDDNWYVHELEETEEDDEEDEHDEFDDDEDDDVECPECGSLDTEYVRTCVNCRIARCKECGEEVSY